MSKNVIGIVVAFLVIVILIHFSEPLEKFATKFNKSPSSGTGTDIYFISSVFTVLICIAVIIFNIFKLISPIIFN